MCDIFLSHLSLRNTYISSAMWSISASFEFVLLSPPVNVSYLGDNYIHNFHLGRYIVGYTFGNLALWRRLSGAVKRDFRTYIRRYTSPNENFEYGYPHSNTLLTFSFKNTVKMYFVAPTYSGCQLHKTARQLHIFTCQPMKSDGS